MKWITACILFVFLTVFTAAAQVRFLQDADDMYDEDMLDEGFKLLQSSIPAASPAERVEIYWRLSMFTMSMTDELEEEGAAKDELLKGFETGVEYAYKAVELDSTAVMAYFYRAANHGRWGETKGNLAALSRAKMMRDDLSLALSYKPDHGDSWYLLGMLYAEVPGWPVGFGNIEFAVSLSRKAIEHQDDFVDFSYYIELANNLIYRAWSMKIRDAKISGMNESFNSPTELFTKYCYYEGKRGFNRTEIYTTEKLNALSDHEEAKSILLWIIMTIQSQTEIDEYDSYCLQEAQAILAELK